MPRNNDIYYNEDRDKIEKANRTQDLENLEKVIMEQSDAITSTVILRH